MYEQTDSESRNGLCFVSTNLKVCTPSSATMAKKKNAFHTTRAPYSKTRPERLPLSRLLELSRQSRIQTPFVADPHFLVEPLPTLGADGGGNALGDSAVHIDTDGPDPGGFDGHVHSDPADAIPLGNATIHEDAGVVGGAPNYDNGDHHGSAEALSHAAAHDYSQSPGQSGDGVESYDDGDGHGSAQAVNYAAAHDHYMGPGWSRDSIQTDDNDGHHVGAEELSPIAAHDDYKGPGWADDDASDSDGGSGFIPDTTAIPDQHLNEDHAMGSTASHPATAAESSIYPRDSFAPSHIPYEASPPVSQGILQQSTQPTVSPDHRNTTPPPTTIPTKGKGKERAHSFSEFDDLDIASQITGSDDSDESDDDGSEGSSRCGDEGESDDEEDSSRGYPYAAWGGFSDGGDEMEITSDGPGDARSFRGSGPLVQDDSVHEEDGDDPSTSPRPDSSAGPAGYAQNSRPNDGGTDDVEMDSVEDDEASSSDRRHNVMDDDIDELLSYPQSTPASKRDIVMLMNTLKDLLDGQNGMLSRIDTLEMRYAAADGGDPGTSARSHGGPSDHPQHRTYNPKHRSSDTTSLQHAVRKHAMRLMHRVLPESDVPAAPSPEVELFGKTGKGGPTLENFRLDMSGVATSWNKQAAQVFAQDFVRVYSSVDEEDAASKFMTHVVYLRTKYLDAKKTSARAAQRKRDLARAKKRYTRRKALRDRRAEASDIHPDVVGFSPLWDTISADVMSGDETDGAIEGGRPRYAITTLRWRSESVTTWLRAFDKLGLSSHFRGDQATRGNFPHYRVVSQLTERRDQPVVGLPENFYDPAWLSSLDETETKRLKMLPAVDLTLSADVLRLCKRFEDVTSPNTPPLPEDHPSLDVFSGPSTRQPSGSRKKGASSRRRKGPLAPI
ncbi:hypothetical protein PLICRDRAFT_28103 [Plicaturopsis crispa FD-325 SS-3]|nr:hypothetical protein PLICRDRAFT_28103 [Plicaturopsis crispa FD-325 SS-3]